MINDQDKAVKVLPENISRCWQKAGFHAHAAGPCFNTLEACRKYRDEYDVVAEALRKFQERKPWSWESCSEWESFNRKWRA